MRMKKGKKNSTKKEAVQAAKMSQVAKGKKNPKKNAKKTLKKKM